MKSKGRKRDDSLPQDYTFTRGDLVESEQVVVESGAQQMNHFLDPVPLSGAEPIAEMSITLFHDTEVCQPAL